jgi:hypothetical protein
LVNGPTLVGVPTVTGAPFTETAVKKSAAVAAVDNVKLVVYLPVNVFVLLLENDPFVVVTAHVLSGLVPRIVAVHLTAFEVVPDVKCSASFSTTSRYLIPPTAVLADDVNAVPLLRYIGLVIVVPSVTSRASWYSPSTLGLYTVNAVLLGVIGHAVVPARSPMPEGAELHVDAAGRTVLSSTHANAGTFTAELRIVVARTPVPSPLRTNTTNFPSPVNCAVTVKTSSPLAGV